MGECADRLQIQVDQEGDREAAELNLDYIDEPEYWEKCWPFLDTMNTVGETVPFLKDAVQLRFLPEITEMRQQKAEDKFPQKIRENRIKTLKFIEEHMEPLLVKRMPKRIRVMTPFGQCTDILQLAIETASFVSDHFFYQRVHEYLLGPLICYVVIDVMLIMTGHSNRLKKPAKFENRVEDYNNKLRDYFSKPKLDLWLYDMLKDRIECYAKVVYCGEQETHGKEQLRRSNRLKGLDKMAEYYNLLNMTQSMETFIEGFSGQVAELEEELLKNEKWVVELDEVLTILHAQKCAGYLEEAEANAQLTNVSDARQRIVEYSQNGLLLYIFMFSRIISSAKKIKTPEDAQQFTKKVLAEWPNGPKTLRTAVKQEKWADHPIPCIQEKRERVRGEVQRAIREFSHKWFEMRRNPCSTNLSVPKPQTEFVEEVIELAFDLIDGYALKSRTQPSMEHFLFPPLITYASIEVVANYYRIEVTFSPHIRQLICDYEGKLFKLGHFDQDSENLFQQCHDHAEISLYKTKDFQYSRIQAMRKVKFGGEGDESSEQLLVKLYAGLDELDQRKQRLEKDKQEGRVDEDQAENKEQLLESTIKIIKSQQRNIPEQIKRKVEEDADKLVADIESKLKTRCSRISLGSRMPGSQMPR